MVIMCQVFVLCSGDTIVIRTITIVIRTMYDPNRLLFHTDTGKKFIVCSHKYITVLFLKL